jgi:uroporphyrinogen-III synthase
MRRLLILRPAPGASETLARAAKLGFHAVSIPLFEVEPVAWELPDPHIFDGLLLTSANAPRLAGTLLQRLRHLPVYAVGAGTAATARKAALDVVAVGEAGVDWLLDSIDPGLRLLHLAGEERKLPAAARQNLTEITVYRSKPVEHARLGDITASVALVHSPRAAQRFAELVADRGSIAIVAISPAAAEAAGGGWESVNIAERPSDDALLALAARLCNKPEA